MCIPTWNKRGDVMCKETSSANLGWHSVYFENCIFRVGVVQNPLSQRYFIAVNGIKNNSAL